MFKLLILMLFKEVFIMSFRVVNKKHYWGIGEYIGRPSVLGNPFRIGSDGSREEVIEKYRRWLWGEIKKKSEVYDELVRLLELEENTFELTLICHCKPLACHGDVIVRALNWLFYQLYDEESWGK